MSDGKTTIVENDRGQRAIVGEHPDQLYLGLDRNAAFFNPVDALNIAVALIAGAGRILERQFRERMGSP